MPKLVGIKSDVKNADMESLRLRYGRSAVKLTNQVQTTKLVVVG